MKITKANIYIVRSGVISPIILKLVTDDGPIGLGEAGIAYGIGGTAAAGMIKDLVSAFILGQDAGQIESFLSEMYDHTFWAKGGGPIVFAGISAIEQALWDIQGQRLGVPVYDLFGGQIRDKVRVYANGWYGAAQRPSEFAKATERPLRDGFTALKFYPFAQRVGRSLRHVTRRMIDRETADAAVQRVKAVRDAVGDDVEIMLDLSGSLTTGESVRLCRRFEELDVAFIEEPADPFDERAIQQIAESIRVPVAVGERHYTRHGFRRIFETRCADVIQPDVGNTGGLMEVKKIAAMAEAYNMRVAPHICGSALIAAATLQVEANIPNFMIHEMYPYFKEGHGYVQVLENSPEDQMQNGYMPVPNRPGIGAVLAEKAVAPFLWSECSL